jgi:hypothetical protein
MSNDFTYSILQYKHNLVLGENINIGVLFYFSKDNSFEFVSGDISRAKAIYLDFDTALYNSYFKVINQNLLRKIDLFYNEYDGKNLSSFIHKNIFSKDASGLVFSEPIQVPNVFKDKETAINEYSRLLLPGVNTEKPIKTRHSESYLVRKFSNYIFNDNTELEKRVKKNVKIKTKFLDLNFNFSWDNDIKNYLKPISFDLTEPTLFQTKAASYYGILSQLNELQRKNDFQFNFIIARPQDKTYANEFENALDFLSSVKNKNNFIYENQLEEYSNELISKLSSN